MGIGELAYGVPLETALKDSIDGSGYVGLAEDEKTIAGITEQKALIEALTRCWAVSYLPQFLKEYEVLCVEREEQVELASGVVMMVRPDLLVRRRADGALLTWQLKTAKRVDEKWAAQWPLDQMTISEVLAVEAGLQKIQPGNDAVVSGVIVQGLVKGETKEYPKGSGEWYVNSPLLRAWKKMSDKPHPLGDWSARWAWTDESGNHTLGKGWRLVPVYTDYPGGVAGWIEWLQQNDPAILEQQIVTLQPILRAPHEMERWKRQVVLSELEIRASRDWDEPLDQFPMHTSSGNCVWPYKCTYFELCHGMAQPDDLELFKPRELNHKNEQLETK
jgi:hypothetical protein